MACDTKAFNEISGVLSKGSANNCEVETSNDKEGWRKKLRLLQCPFSWDDLLEVRGDNKTVKDTNRIAEIEEKREELDVFDTLEYRKFVLNVVLMYEHFHDGNTGNSLAVLSETKELLKSSSSPVGILSKFVMDVKVALSHIFFACLAYMQFYSDNLEGVERTFAKITQFDDLNKTCKAAISGIHATTLMEYGYKGNKMAMMHIRTALFLDPNQGEWHFLLGRCLGKLRRTDNGLQLPSEEELNALEKAIKWTENNPHYIIFLAQTYREAAHRLYSERRNRTTGSTAGIGKMNQQSLELYMKALELRPDCPHINMRCAQGLMKFPHPYKNVTIAKQCLDNALQHRPNNAMVTHVAAVFYDHYNKDATKAKMYYTLATELGSFGAYMELLRLRYNEDRLGYNPISDLEVILQKYTAVPYQLEALMQIGSYFLFMKCDIENAFKYWEKVIDQDPDSQRLKMHKNNFLPNMKPVNVYEVLCDKSLEAMQSNGGGKALLYQQIITKCKKHHPGRPAAQLPLPRMVLEEKLGRRFRSSGYIGGKTGKRGYIAGERGRREDVCGTRKRRRRREGIGGVRERWGAIGGPRLDHQQLNRFQF